MQLVVMSNVARKEMSLVSDYRERDLVKKDNEAENPAELCIVATKVVS